MWIAVGEKPHIVEIVRALMAMAMAWPRPATVSSQADPEIEILLSDDANAVRAP